MSGSRRVLGLPASGSPTRGPGRPPSPERRPYTHREHGVLREDPWHWLRDRADPAVRAHLEAENRWTDEQLAPLEPLRRALYGEFLARVQETDATTPEPWGPWAYYRRTEQGRAYTIHCRRPRDGGDEQVLVDVNALAREHAFAAVMAVTPSPDHALLGYATDFSAEERYTLRFRDLARGVDLPDALPDASGSYAWVGDRTVWFCTLDAAMRSHRLWSYEIGGGKPPALLFEEPDDGFRVAVSRTRSGRFVRMHLFNPATTDTWIAPLGAEPRLRPLLPRRKGQKYQVAHAGDSLFVATNVGADGVPGSAVNHRLLEVPIADLVLGDEPRSELPGREVVPHRSDVELVSLDGFRDHLVVVERDRGQLELRVIGARDGSDRRVPLAERPCVVEVGSNHEWDARRVRYDYSSLTTPDTDFEADLATLESERLREKPVPTYDRTRYRTSRLEAVAPDGTHVPISVVHHVDVDLAAGPHPAVVYGYGAYGITVDPVFSPTRVSLLDRGIVFAIAHVRGGGFLGRSWYEAGKLRHKARSFSDFVACARHLVDLGITAPDRLVAMGGSAGGLLVAGAANLAPELFRGVLAAVPFVDVVSTMFDTTLPLTIPEFDEWGNPVDRAVFDAMLAWSPYDNVRAVPYPDVLATAGWSDPRVQYWEPAKWVARLRERATSGEFLLHVQMGAGHQGPSGRYGALEHRAFEYAWVVRALARTT